MDAERGVVGRLATALPAALARRWRGPPRSAPSQAALVKGLLTQRLRADHGARQTATPEAASAAALTLPLPEAPENVETRDVTPVPRLELFMADVPLAAAHRWYAEEVDHDGIFSLPLARLAFDYGGQVVGHSVPTPVLERTEGDTLILTPRDKAAEDKAMKRVAEIGLRSLAGGPLQVIAELAGALFIAPPGRPGIYEFISACDEPSRFIAFSLEAVPKLAQEGWQIAYSDDYPYRVAEGEAAGGPMSAKARASTGSHSSWAWTTRGTASTWCRISWACSTACRGRSWHRPGRTRRRCLCQALRAPSSSIIRCPTAACCRCPARGWRQS